MSDSKRRLVVVSVPILCLLMHPKATTRDPGSHEAGEGNFYIASRGPCRCVEPGASYATVPLKVDLILKLRRRRGLSQHQMSMCVGVQGAAAVSAWERGVAVPRPATLVRVAEVLGVEPLELLALDQAGPS